MNKHLKYLHYVLRHKWHVAGACFREGLYWRGLTHDWHKFLPSEWFAYTNFFYDKPTDSIEKNRNETGYYKPTDTGDCAFDFAWLLHQKRADHHWQYWAIPEDKGGVKLFPMSDGARLEMICDWYGASKAQSHGGWPSVLTWYSKNKDKMQLHPNTRTWVEVELVKKTWLMIL